MDHAFPVWLNHELLSTRYTKLGKIYWGDGGARWKDNFPHVPVVVLTGVHDTELAVSCRRNGVVDYLLKPVEGEELKAAVALDGTTRDGMAVRTVTLLPRARERYKVLVRDLGKLSKRHVAQAREQVRGLVGEIRLVPMKAGYLEAEMTGRYAGLAKLAVGAKLNNLVAGERF